MPWFDRDGLRFHFREAGAGRPFLFQHGLGGDSAQPFGRFAPPNGIRLLGLDARGHGETTPLGDEGQLSFAAFADDAAALLDRLEIPTAAVGGISMGAGVALNLALGAPDRVEALILVRPAWLAAPMPAGTRDLYAAIARLIRAHGAAQGRDRFARSAAYGEIARESPATAASLLGQFARPRAEETVAILERLPADAPFRDLRVLGTIRVPTLVLACRFDAIHPFAHGERLAADIPGARLIEITAKDVSAPQHARDIQGAIERFLLEHLARR